VKKVVIKFVFLIPRRNVYVTLEMEKRSSHICVGTKIGHFLNPNKIPKLLITKTLQG